MNENYLKDKIWFLTGCPNFGDDNGMDGSCVECFHHNYFLWERCVIFSKSFTEFHQMQETGRKQETVLDDLELPF